ncbi:MAG TPA: hypothetical protein VIY48_18030 [Candidatus Paceibacterota bacterium]
MASFTKGGSTSTPFGRNEFLRSTQDVKVESYTLAASTVPTQTIDGVANQKIVQPGTVMAKITSGGDSGKVGPFQANATDGRQTAANIVGLCMTFLPWQTMERDVEIGVVYQATAVQAWCFEYTNATTRIALSDTTADAMRGLKRLQVNFA